MTGPDELSPSQEDYLEAILLVQRDQSVARARDLVERLGVSSSSVTGALHSLAAKDLINYAPYSYVTLTAEGERAAERIAVRHETLKRFFVDVLGVGAEEADGSACRLEHAIPGNLLDRLTWFVEFISSRPEGGPDWLEEFRSYCDSVEGRDSGQQAAPRDDGADRPVALLCDLDPGDHARIVRVTGRRSPTKRLVGMGLVPGAELRVERAAPLGDPVEISVRGNHLSFRREEAAEIAVELIASHRPGRKRRGWRR